MVASLIVPPTAPIADGESPGGRMTVPEGTSPDWPDELRLLLGPDVVPVIAELLRPLALHPGLIRASSVNHQPERATSVTYRVEVRGSGEQRSAETLVVRTTPGAPKGAARLRCGDVELAAWRWPHDPALPGLDRALDTARVAELFADLGMGGGRVHLRVRAYRPGRRAVVEARNDRGRLFMKVVRPHRVEALHVTHRLVAGALPIADSLGWTDDGILVMPAIAGATLREQLRSADSPRPSPESVIELLDALPSELVENGRPRDRRHSLTHHAGVIRATAPDHADQVDALVGRLLDADDGRSADIVPVHGDLYESQLIVGVNGLIRGLIDVDTAGPGERVDDLANFCAHLSVLATTVPPDVATTVRGYGAELLRRFERDVDPHTLRVRVAMGVVGLATGPFRVLEDGWVDATARRLRLAEGWLDSAEQSRSPHETSLIGASSTSHSPASS